MKEIVLKLLLCPLALGHIAIHNHQPDGNFGHVNALYGLLSALRDRYPDLLIENVSGGGNRLDIGMLRYTDVAWMDDRTAPSVHVRHNIEGLTAVFPPASTWRASRPARSSGR